MALVYSNDLNLIKMFPKVYKPFPVVAKKPVIKPVEKEQSPVAKGWDFISKFTVPGFIGHAVGKGEEAIEKYNPLPTGVAEKSGLMVIGVVGVVLVLVVGLLGGRR